MFNLTLNRIDDTNSLIIVLQHGLWTYFLHGLLRTRLRIVIDFAPERGHVLVPQDHNPATEEVIIDRLMACPVIVKFKLQHVIKR